LLFNLVIEPLACLIRNSELKGIKIPGKEDNLIISHFADDTTVYLSSENELEIFWGILRLWCVASTGKFNDHKTVLLPFGWTEYRAMVLKQRRINNKMKIGTIEERIRIIPDGQTCRILGAWIGNTAPYITPWPLVLEKIAGDPNSSLEGKRHIISMAIGGRTQYLTRVQGMPNDIDNGE
jgi:hypothetical protein